MPTSLITQGFYLLSLVLVPESFSTQHFRQLALEMEPAWARTVSGPLPGRAPEL